MYVNIKSGDMHHIRKLKTNNSTDHMTAKYKVAITAGVAQLIFESGRKPQNTSNIDLCLVRMHNYEANKYG